MSNFTVNGTQLPTVPSSHGWMSRSILGYDGNHQPIYPFLREYELDWDTIDPATFTQLWNFYQSAATGSVVVTLPQWAGVLDVDNFDAGYVPYSGCTITEPTFKSFMTGYYTGVKLLIIGIQT